MIPAFPKLFTLGDRFTKNIWNGPVEITEKIDGSQFNFGRFQGHVRMRSKSAEVFHEDNNKMFDRAKDFVKSVEHKLPEGVFFHGEYLRSPRHNTLTYNRVPKNNFVLFGVTGEEAPETPAMRRAYWSERFDCEDVPVLHEGAAPGDGDRYQWLMDMISKESVLGLAQREGVVIKNYTQTVMVGDVAFPLVGAKVVSSEFKEKHKVSWSESEGKDRLTLIGEAYNAKPRWVKAVQHLRDSGALTDSPKDIGPILKELNQDIDAEEKENIKDMLWNVFSKDIKRIAVRGFPEWYKETLTVAGT